MDLYKKSENLPCSPLSAWRYYAMLLLFFVALVVILLDPISSSEFMPGIADMLNHFAAISQAKLALAEGQFPLRVTPLDVNGWRYPFYQFYSSSGYLFSGLIYQWLTPNNVFLAYKVAVGTALVFGSLYLYRLANWFVASKPAALLAAVAYLMSPYCVILVNHLGAFNEVLAVGMMPAVLFYTILCYSGPFTVRVCLQASLCWYLLITLHSITFVSTSASVFLLLFLMVCFDRSRWKDFCRVVLVYGFSCLLAMWYLAPVIPLMKYLKLQGTLYFIKQLAFQPTLANLLSPMANVGGGYLDDGSVSLISQIHPALGLPMLFAIGVCVYAWMMRAKLGRVRADAGLLPLLLLLLVLVFLIWSPFNVWVYLSSSFTIIQYSWRLLSQFIWVAALLLAWSVCWLFQGKANQTHVIVGVVLIVWMASSWLSVDAEGFWQLKRLPKSMLLIPGQDVYSLRPDRYPYYIANIKGKNFLDVKQMRSLCQQRGQDTVCQIDKPGRVRLVELPLLYYPQLVEVKLNGRAVPAMAVLYEDRLVTAVELQPGVANKIEARFTGLAWANELSRGAWLVWVCAGFYSLMGLVLRHFRRRSS